ncbi:MAG: hypothetical protein FWG63_09910 [Defluviitaleaceae bacterium]|nr:hypothetical protein [Defluviitaleaceae bacterium]
MNEDELREALDELGLEGQEEQNESEASNASLETEGGEDGEDAEDLLGQLENALMLDNDEAMADIMNELTGRTTEEEADIAEDVVAQEPLEENVAAEETLAEDVLTQEEPPQEEPAQEVADATADVADTVSAEEEQDPYDSNQPLTDEDLAAILRELGADTDDPVIESMSATSNLDTPPLEQEADAEPDLSEQEQPPEQPSLEDLEPPKTSKFKVPNLDRMNKFATKKVAISLAAAILIFSVIGVVAAMVLTPTLPPLDMAEEGQRPIVVSQGTIGAGGANFIFVSEQRGTGSSNFFMSRMLIDHFATVFYFGNTISWENYAVQLIDDQGRQYPLSIRHFRHAVGDRLSFEPIHTDARGVLLTIVNIHTGDEVAFPIEFYGILHRMPSFHLNTRHSSILGESVLTVTGGRFAASGSSVFYELVYDYSGFSFENIFLNQGVSAHAFYDHQTFDIGDNRILGRIDFEPIGTGGIDLNLMFSNTFITYSINQSMNVQGLLANIIENQIRMPIGQNTLVLERLGRFGADFILVLHGMDYEGMRQETRIDATLHVTDSTGHSVSLNANVTSGPFGTDVMFPVTATPPGTSLESVVLELRTVFFGGDNFSITIPNQNLESTPHFMDIQVLEQGRELVLAGGHERAEVITYAIDNFDFTAIYRAITGNVLVDYLVTAYRADIGWHFTTHRLN